MAGEWPYVPLGSLAADHDGAIAIGPFGSSMKSSVYAVDGVPVIRGTNIKTTRELTGEWVYISDAFADAMPRCVVRDGDLVFPHRGSIGEVALVPSDRERYFLSTSCMKITMDRTKADPRYVAYYFKSEAGRDEILRFASQVGTPGIGQPLASLRQFTLPAPPVHVQRATADILSSLDDKIDLNRRMNETLEAMARAIFQDWFVAFGPTRAKMEGRPPYFAPDLWELFPDRLDAEEKPEGWASAPLSFFMEIISGGTPPTSDSNSWGGQVPWFSVVDTPAGSDLFVFDTERKLTEHGLRRSPGSLVPADTVIVTARGTVGKLAITGVEMTLNQSCYALRPLQGFGDRGLFFLVKNAVARFHDLAHGAVFDTITKATFDAIPSVVPPLLLARAFEEAVGPLMLRIKANVTESQTLASIRNLLLHRLMSGEIRVVEAEIQIAAA